MDFIEIVKVILFGILEGITEWLPVSSTGHILLFEEVLPLKLSSPDRAAAFLEIFKVLIQLGAIFAVVLIYWKKLFPFFLKKDEKTGKLLGVSAHGDIIQLWLKIAIACVPAAIVGLLADDFLEAHLQTPFVISFTLILYGVLFIFIENKNKNRVFPIQATNEITYKHALLIGIFQLLALIPGTSRSGATIIGALLIGVSRPAGAEFSFFLAIPVMLGASALKLIKFLLNNSFFTGAELGYLLIAMATAFIVSAFAVKILTDFAKKRDFKFFGWYRIVLGAIVIATLVLPSML